MADLPDPNDMFSRIKGQGGGRLHKNTAKQFYKTPNVQQNMFGTPKDLQEEAVAYGYGDRGLMDVNDFTEAQEAMAALEEQDAPAFRYRQTGDRSTRVSGDPRLNLAETPMDYYTLDPNIPEDAAELENRKPVDWSVDSKYKEVPTKTHMPQRPRTVAASYSPDREVLTIIFLDGTMYNYYQVTEEEWFYFKGKQQKYDMLMPGGDGRLDLDGKPRGMANAGDVPEDVQLLAYTRARGAQYTKAKSEAKARGEEFKMPKLKRPARPQGPKPIIPEPFKPGTIYD